MSALQNIKTFLQKATNEIGFLATSLAVLVSMILSNMFELEPCQLCWYQRIFMFPLPFVFAAAVLRKDKHTYITALPLAIVGGSIALYHTLLQWGIVSESVTSCSLTGPSCAEPEIMYFGFLTIPFGSFLVFATVILLMIMQVSKHPAKLSEQAQQRLSKLLLIAFFLSVLVVAVIRIFDIQLT